MFSFLNWEMQKSIEWWTSHSGLAKKADVESFKKEKKDREGLLVCPEAHFIKVLFMSIRHFTQIHLTREIEWYCTFSTVCNLPAYEQIYYNANLFLFSSPVLQCGVLFSQQVTWLIMSLVEKVVTHTPTDMKRRTYTNNCLCQWLYHI